VVVVQTADGAREFFEILLRPDPVAPALPPRARDQTIANQLDQMQNEKVTYPRPLNNETPPSDLNPIHGTEMAASQNSEDLITLGADGDLIDPMSKLSPEHQGELNKLQEKFNTPANWARAALIALGAALTIVMLVQIGQNWHNMSVVDQVLQVLQALQQAMAVLVDAIGFLVCHCRFKRWYQ
jgi:hypothetical protein